MTIRTLPAEEHLLPLDLWRAQMGLNPWHFWGLADQRIAPIESKCSGLVLEHDWQGSDAAGRASVREAILRAEHKLAAYLGYRVAPAYAESTVDWPRAAVGPARWLNADSTGRRVAIALEEGYIQALGVELRTLIGEATTAASTLVYSDQFATGMPDTFTITLPIPEGMNLEAEQVAVYFTAADRLDGAEVSERWRIQPVQVRISGGSVIVVGRRWLVVRPVLYEAPSGRALDPTQVATWVTSLEVYQRTTDGSGTTASAACAVLVYESGACCGWGGSDPATTRQVAARAGIRDGTLGLITPAATVYDASSGTWSDVAGLGCWSDPDRVAVRYLAGYPLEAGQMARGWQQVVAVLAAAELKRRICACRETNERLHDLQQDLTLESTQTERYRPAQEDLSNPFGTRRGHVQAWRAAKLAFLSRGIAS